MSKSSYEQALKKLALIQGRLSTDYGKFLEVKHALKQAQKQEKLLNLYREKEKHEQEFPALNNIEYKDYQRIKTKIRELEQTKEV